MFWNYTQCNLKVCKNHYKISIHIKIPKEIPANNINPTTIIKKKYDLLSGYYKSPLYGLKNDPTV